MKFEREIPIGLDARRKKWQGGAIKAPPPPMGLGLMKKFLEDGWGGEVEIMLGTFKMASFCIKLTIYKNKNEIIIIILIIISHLLDVNITLISLYC